MLQHHLSCTLLHVLGVRGGVGGRRERARFGHEKDGLIHGDHPDTVRHERTTHEVENIHASAHPPPQLQEQVARQLRPNGLVRALTAL